MKTEKKATYINTYTRTKKGPCQTAEREYIMEGIENKHPIISWHRNMHQTLCHRANLSVDLLEMHIKYLKLTDANSNPKNYLKAFQTKLLGMTESVTPLEASMEPWQLYQTGHPAWTRDFSPTNIRLIQRVQELIDNNDLEDDIDVRPMLLSGNDAKSLQDRYVRVYRILERKEHDQRNHNR